MNALTPYLEGFGALPKARQPWLRVLKEQALLRAGDRGFPGPRDEAWKYTSVAALEKRGFRPAVSPVKLDAAALAAIAINGFDAHRAVFVNGRFDAALSRLPKGVRALAVSTSGDALQSLPSLSEIWQADTFTNLNTALFQDGLVLELDEAAVLDEPLELLHISAPEATAASHHLRCIVRLGAGAHATLVERYAGLEGAKHLTNTVVQIDLAKNAQLTHVRLQEESGQSFHVGRILVEQKEGSRYLSHNLQLGGAWSRLDIDAHLTEPGAHVELYGFYAVDGRQHIDNHTRIDHMAPGTVSRELYHGILDGHGRAVFNGKVLVAPHAVKTDAEQTNRNLILSRGAEIDTKPELEIYADDVKCSHGATIGQLDEDQLFYLRSRGLDADTARGLLIAAFAERLLGALPHPALATHVRGRLGGSVTLPVQA